MNKNELAQIILMRHPNMRIYYLILYELYKLLNLDFDLFLTEDIYNYDGDFYTLLIQGNNHYSSFNHNGYNIYWPKSIKFKITDISVQGEQLILEYNAIHHFHCVNGCHLNKHIFYINNMSYNSTHNMLQYVECILNAIVNKNKFTQEQINIIDNIIKACTQVTSFIHNPYEVMLKIINDIKGLSL